MILQFFADLLGSSEPALRLLLSLLVGYPMLHLHRKVLKDAAPGIQHLYFALCGISIAVFNYGSNVIHSMICIIVAWVILMVIGGTMLSVIITFVFQISYLLIAYYVTETDTYDIKWTMPHCVLTLRLIALTFDVFDGSKSHEKLSQDQQLTALKIRPSIIEIAGQTYFPPSFVVGPQFSMRRYLDFIHHRLYPEATSSPEAAGIKRGIYGLIFLMVYQVGSSWIPDTYLISQQFAESCFLHKMIILAIWGKVHLYKYISCWMITEGACIFCGLAYSGVDEHNGAIWKGCANVKLYLFETGTSFLILVKGFNTNTNNWIAQYVYKRLKFLNNVYLSQIGSLIFLSVWHGFHSGYYACFLMEFIIIFVEKNFLAVLKKYPEAAKKLESQPLSLIITVLLKIYTFVFMGYSLASFALLKSYKWWQFYKSVYFIGHVFFASWFAAKPLLVLLLRRYGGPPLQQRKQPPLEDSEKLK